MQKRWSINYLLASIFISSAFFNGYGINKVKTCFITNGSNFFSAEKKSSLLRKINVPYLSIDQLRAGRADTAQVVFITDQRKTGMFKLNVNSTLSDDSALVIVTHGKRYERVYEGDMKPEWFGAIANDNKDDTQAFIKLKNKSSGSIKIPPGLYLINNFDLESTSIIGAGNGLTILKATGKNSVLLLGYDAPHWRKKMLQDITIDGDNKLADGIKFQARNHTEISGRWIIERVNFLECNKAIYKPTGNIGNVFRDCYFEKNNYGYYALGKKTPFMHAGFDSFYNCSFTNNLKSGIYINSITPGTGGTVFNSCHFEGNSGFGLFIKNYKEGWSPLSINGIWTENNATAKSVEIDGIIYQPSALYLENTDNFSFTNSALADGIIIKNSKGSFRATSIYGSGIQSIDSLSIVYGEEMITDIYRGGILINSLRDTKRPLSGIADILNAPARRVRTKNFNALLKESFSEESVSLEGNIEKQVGKLLTGGISFDNYNRFTIPANRIQISKPVQIKKGMFYVLSISIRQITDEKPIIHFSYSMTACNNLQQQLIKGKWITLATVGEADTSGVVRLYISTSKKAYSIIDLQALQIVEFNTKQEAITFYNQGYIATSNKM